MKVLIVGLNYAPEPVGIGPYTTGLAEDLVARGHQVEAVVGEPYYPRWRRFANGPPVGRRVENGVGVTRCRHFIPANPTGPRRVLHLASFGLFALVPAIRAALRLKPDIVFTVAPSLLSLPAAWLAARLCGARLWAHVQDFEVEAAFATGLLDDEGAVSTIARRTENRLLRLADRVSTISPQMIRRLRLKGIPADRTYELRNWANTDFGPDMREAQRYRDEWAIGPRKVALYSGNIANKQGIEIVIEAARRLRHRDDLLFVICGQGPNRRQLAALSADLPNVQLHDLQSSKRMGGLLALAYVHLLPQIPGAADLALPSKLTNMLISGRPVVATADAGTGIAAEVRGCGIITKPGDADALAGAIVQLVDDSVLAGELGRAGARRARTKWGQSEILDRFECALTGLRDTEAKTTRGKKRFLAI